MLIKKIPFPSRIDRYILEEIIHSFLGTTFFVVFILMMFQTLRLSEFLIVHGASAQLLGAMGIYMMILLLPITLPVAFLISVLMAFGRLSSDSELTALKASGFKMTRLSISVILFSILICFFTLILNLKVIPWSERGIKETETKIGNVKAAGLLKEGTFTSSFFDLIVFANKIEPRNNQLEQIFIFDERETQNPLTYIAKKAQITAVKSNNEFDTSILLSLYDGSSHHFNLKEKNYEKTDFGIYHLFLKLTKGENTIGTTPQMYSYADLLKKIKDNPLSTYEGREYLGELWRRYATAIAPFFFSLLGIGFGTFRYRTAKASANLIGFIILLVYWVIQTQCFSAMQQGILHPFVAMQFPNLIMLTIGIIVFRRASW